MVSTKLTGWRVLTAVFIALVCLTSPLRAAILVIGGGGYIGSHTVIALINAGHEVAIYDQPENIDPTTISVIEEKTGTKPFVYTGAMFDPHEPDSIFQARNIDAVIHLAPRVIARGTPSAGHETPVTSAKALSTPAHIKAAVLNMLRSMMRNNVYRLIFSSSSPAYMEDDHLTDPAEDFQPSSGALPFEDSQLAVEQLLRSTEQSDNRWQIASLRYLHPVGACVDGRLGETYTGYAKNLVPILCEVANGERHHLKIYGSKYDTSDGTVERDYLHVEDVAAAHVAAVDWMVGKQREEWPESGRLEPDRQSLRIWSIGNGTATTVIGMNNIFSAVNDINMPYKLVEAHKNDTRRVVSRPSAFTQMTGWKAEKSMGDIMRSAWRFHQLHTGTSGKH